MEQDEPVGGGGETLAARLRSRCGNLELSLNLQKAEMMMLDGPAPGHDPDPLELTSALQRQHCQLGVAQSMAQYGMPGWLNCGADQSWACYRRMNEL